MPATPIATSTAAARPPPPSMAPRSRAGAGTYHSPAYISETQHSDRSSARSAWAGGFLPAWFAAAALIGLPVIIHLAPERAHG